MMWPDCSPPRAQSAPQQLGQHVAVAHRGGGHLQARPPHRLVEAVVGHHRDRDPVAGQAAGAAQVEGRQRQELVAVHHDALAVHGQQPVTVAVEGEPHVEAALGDPGRQLIHVGGAAAVVDVAPVGLGAHGLRLGPQAAEDLRSHAVGGAVGAVQQDLQPTQVEAAEAQLELAQVVAGGPVQLAYPADGAGHRVRPGRHALLDPALGVVGELGAVGAEELDPVVAVGVVRGRHHGRDVEPVAAQQQRGARRGEHSAQQRVAAPGGDAGGQRCLEHLARLAGVADDQDLRRLGLGLGRGGAAQGNRELCGEQLPGHSAHPIGAEEAHPGLPTERRPGVGRPSTARSSVHRFENCGRLRAFLRPAFLRSFTRGSRVRKPRFLSSERRLGSASTSARAMPWRRAPA